MRDASTFDLKDYGGMIEGFLRRGYDLADYRDVRPDQRQLILRHDVDFSLSAALEMARFEAAQGWQAYYFVLLRTEFYNPFSKAGLAALHELAALKHRIGLHFDASLYQQAKDIPHQAGRECDLLASIVEQPVEVLSLHRPHPDLLGQGFEVAGRLNAYGARYFQEIAYCSDSRGGWHHGHPLDHAAVAMGGAMQLLTHPIWWTGRRASPLRRLEIFAATRMRRIENEIAENCDVWRRRDGAE